MPFDINSTRAQLRAIELMPRVYSFLADTFAVDGGAVEDDKAIYDYRKGELQMAPFVVPGTGGVVLSRDKFETREIGFCQIAPERIVADEDINQRSFGENVLGAMTPEQRARKMYAKDATDMRAAIQRRREWMARQVLTTGKLEIFRYTREGRDKHTSMIADYNFTNHFTPANVWSGSDAKVDYDMRKMFDLVYDGLGYVDVIVMDPEAAEAMLSNSQYVKQLDIRNIDMGEINTRYRGQGVRFLGHNSDGVEMYSCSGRFIDDDGLMKPLLDKGTVIAGSRGILNMPHGPVTQVEGVGSSATHKTYIKKEVPLRYGSEESNAVKNRITSRPTVVPFNVDAWAVAHVL